MSRFLIYKRMNCLHYPVPGKWWSFSGSCHTKKLSPLPLNHRHCPGAGRRNYLIAYIYIYIYPKTAYRTHVGPSPFDPQHYEIWNFHFWVNFPSKRCGSPCSRVAVSSSYLLWIKCTSTLFCKDPLVWVAGLLLGNHDYRVSCITHYILNIIICIHLQLFLLVLLTSPCNFLSHFVMFHI